MILATQPQSNFRYWNDTAIECYKRGCICSGCPLPKMESMKCQMKSAVLGLVRKFGKPK